MEFCTFSGCCEALCFLVVRVAADYWNKNRVIDSGYFDTLQRVDKKVNRQLTYIANGNCRLAKITFKIRK